LIAPLKYAYNGSSNYFKATKEDVQSHFATHGTGTIKEIKLMSGFGFIEYEDPMDARDVVPGKSSHMILGLLVQEHIC
jgi:hypothetical protein